MRWSVIIKNFPAPFSFPDFCSFLWTVRFLKKNDVLVLFVKPSEDGASFNRFIKPSYIKGETFKVEWKFRRSTTDSIIGVPDDEKAPLATFLLGVCRQKGVNFGEKLWPLKGARKTLALLDFDRTNWQNLHMVDGWKRLHKSEDLKTNILEWHVAQIINITINIGRKRKIK